MAFTRILPSKENESDDSQQTSPAYLLTFIRYSNRDLINYKGEDALATRKQFVVVNDAVSITVSNSKSSPTASFSCVLKQGDINYLTAISPGDYVIVNMVNWETKAMDLRERALAGKPINRSNDGFKGLFKISNVNMVLSVADNGVKQYQVQVTARGFDEFNNVLYFNPALTKATAESSGFLFINSFDNWSDLLQKPETNNVQFLLKEIVNRSIGQGLKILDNDVKLNQVPIYEVPALVAKLLNMPKAKTMADINKYYFGIWKLGSSSPTSTSSYTGFSSFFKSEVVDGEEDALISFFNTGKEENNLLQGSRQIAFQDFQQVQVWSLIKDYSNPVINECYTCYRVDREGKYVYPSLIARQKPFNNRNYENFVTEKGGAKSDIAPNYTKFLDLPRWKIKPELIKSINIGRSDQGRINFVQVFSRSLSIDPKFNFAAQMALGNFVEDKQDVKRHGRKPYIVNCNYDFPNAGKEIRAKEWAFLLADWVFNGHLKMNGNMQTVGIEEPICIGDNLEFDDVVFHIESITHTMNITANGLKVFRTNLSLSMGISNKSSKTVPVYAEMDHTDSLTRRKDDFRKEQVLPGFSDTQDLPSRTEGEEIDETKQKTFSNPNVSDKGKK